MALQACVDFGLGALTCVVLCSCIGEPPEDALGRKFTPGTDCVGAYTPHSEVCSQANAGREDEFFSRDIGPAQENTDRLLHSERCAMGIVGAPGPQGVFEVSFRTQVLGDPYSPRNCGAVWIEDSLGFYVRTLELWARDRKSSIVAWQLSVCQADTTVTAPDVITSATLPNAAAHSTRWDTKDYLGRVVPDGVYSLWMQVTESEFTPEGPSVKIDFTKGPVAYSRMSPATRGFEDILLEYRPQSAEVERGISP
jgi:hypothetical protein